MPVQVGRRGSASGGGVAQKPPLFIVLDVDPQGVETPLFLMRSAVLNRYADPPTIRNVVGARVELVSQAASGVDRLDRPDRRAILGVADGDGRLFEAVQGQRTLGGPVAVPLPAGAPRGAARRGAEVGVPARRHPRQPDPEHLVGLASSGVIVGASSGWIASQLPSPSVSTVAAARWGCSCRSRRKRWCSRDRCPRSGAP